MVVKNSKLKAVRQYYSGEQVKTVYRVLGNNLARARVSSGMSQMDVHHATGITKNRLSEYENGKAIPDVLTLILLAKIYGCSVDYILGLSCEPFSDVYASHINNVKNNLKHYFEPMLDEMVASVTDVMKKVDKDSHVKLVDSCQNLTNYLAIHGSKIKEFDPILHILLFSINNHMRELRMQEGRKHVQMQAQLEAIRERHDRAEGHLMLSDKERVVQLSLPLPEPSVEYIEFNEVACG